MTDPHNSYDSETPFERKSCYDCAHLKPTISWWCTCKEAIKARGTQIPGCIHCPYWSPDWSMIKREPIPYEEKYGYENPLERDFWSDRATRIVFRVVALVALVFSVLFAFEIL